MAYKRLISKVGGLLGLLRVETETGEAEYSIDKGAHWLPYGGVRVDDVSYAGETGTLTISYSDNTTQDIEMGVDDFLAGASFNPLTNVLSLTMSDESVIEVDLNDIFNSKMNLVTSPTENTVPVLDASGGLTGTSKIFGGSSFAGTPNVSTIPSESSVKAFVEGKGYLTSAAIPSKTSDLTNDSGFTTASAVASGYVAKDGSKVLSDNNYDSNSKSKLDNLVNITAIGDNLTLTNGTLAANSSGGASVPSGCVLSYAGSGTVPTGFLLCNGAAVSRTTYADLFTAIGTTYGAGDESTTFNIPDFRGRFLRGYDGTRSAAIGTAQDDGLPEIAGGYNYFFGDTRGTFTGAFASSSNGNANLAQGSSTSNQYRAGTLVFDASDSNSIYGNSSYVTPYNFAVQFIIKY